MKTGTVFATDASNVVKERSTSMRFQVVNQILSSTENDGETQTLMYHSPVSPEYFFAATDDDKLRAIYASITSLETDVPENFGRC